MTPLEVATARALTPGCAEVLHLNHAGASLMPQPVLDAVISHLEREGRTGGYEAANEAAAALAHTYNAVASLLGCAASEVALTESATRAWDAAVYSLPIAPSQRVLISRAEYASNAIALLQLCQRTGAEILLVDNDQHGQIDIEALAEALAHHDVALVSLVHVPTQSGLVNPAAAVGHLCQAAGVTFVLDACQSVGQLPLDVTELGCDVLTGTGRKFLRGPRGTGFLYMRQALLEQVEPVMLDAHAADWIAPDRFTIRSDARRFENWECNLAARLGLGAAIDHALSWGVTNIAARSERLAAGLRARLAEIPGVTGHDRGEHLCAITTFSVADIDPTVIQQRLRAEAVNVSVGTASFARLDLPPRGLESVVRASVHYITTEDELDRFAECIRTIASAPAS